MKASKIEGEQNAGQPAASSEGGWPSRTPPTAVKETKARLKLVIETTLVEHEMHGDKAQLWITIEHWDLNGDHIATTRGTPGPVGTIGCH